MGSFERKVTTELVYQFGEVYIEVKFLQNFSEEYAAANGLEVGHRCGYVTMFDESGKELEYADTDSYEVHGGVTYIKQNGGYVTLGFDCAHGGDSLETCTLDYVRKQAEALATQMVGGVR